MEEINKEEKEGETKNNTRKTRIIIGVITILVLAFIAYFLVPIVWPSKIVQAEFSKVEKICELATLECYYHDVAEFEKEADGLFKYGLFKYGSKRMWMEYDGIVKIGIDVAKVSVEQPDENGVVKIFVPEAKILEINAKKDSMSDPIYENGVFTTVSIEEKAEAFSAAQKAMRENAESDESLLKQAHSNAKELIKQYVLNVGEQIGQKYTVEWIETESTDLKDKDRKGE